MNHWGDQKIEMFCQKWKSSTAKFCIAKFKDGTRARSAAKAKDEDKDKDEDEDGDKDKDKDGDEVEDKGKEGESIYCFVLAH
jgi:hypothetical protein